MNDRKLLFIYNTHAGRERISSQLADVIDVFTKHGYLVSAYPTQRAGDARTAVQEREEGYSLVVCSGGDGTLDEVVSGMMKSPEQLPIGMIPAGSTNDFCQSIGIPTDLVEAAKVAVSGRSFHCDVGILNQSYFVYVAGFGLFTDVSYQTPQDMKNLLGRAAYLLEGIKKLSDVGSYHLKIAYQDRIIEDDFIYGMVTNSLSVGGLKNITGEMVEFNDGLFEVTLIKYPKNMIELSTIITMLLGRDVDNEYIFHFKTAQLTVDSRKKVAWTLDGEFGGSYKHTEIMVKREGVIIRIP